MKNKKKIIVSIVAVVLLLVCAVGATLAWFTDSDDVRTNTFVVGNVEIVLYESDTAIANEDRAKNQTEATDIQGDYETYLNTLFDEAGENGAQNFVPGYTVAKNAYVSNVGTVDAWVGATYKIRKDLVTDGAYKGINVVVNTTTGGNSAWELLGTKVTTEDEVDYITYYYGLTDVLDSDKQAPVFVQSVSIDQGATNETADDFFHKLTGIVANSNDVVDAGLRTFNIEIRAYAIQAPSLNKDNVADALATGFSGIFTGFGA